MIPARAFREGDELIGFFTGLGPMWARVEPASRHGEALTFVDADGHEITAELEAFESVGP
jgi:hypothetical protein